MHLRGTCRYLRGSSQRETPILYQLRIHSQKQKQNTNSSDITPNSGSTHQNWEMRTGNRHIHAYIPTKKPSIPPYPYTQCIRIIPEAGRPSHSTTATHRQGRKEYLENPEEKWRSQSIKPQRAGSRRRRPRLQTWRGGERRGTQAPAQRT